MKNICLITGAAGLLGKMHAEAILETGKNICITDINLKRLIELYKFLKKNFLRMRLFTKNLM